MKEQSRVEHTRMVADRGIWRRLWSLNVPSKIRMFVWRACSNILPTRDNLHFQKTKIDPQCEFCCQQLESIAHLLWECPFSRNVWALCRGKIQKCSNNAQDIFMLFRWLIDKLSQLELERWAVIAWAIWNTWNKFYFELIQTHPKSIFDGAIGFLQEYQRLVAAQTNNWMVYFCISLWFFCNVCHWPLCLCLYFMHNCWTED